MKKPLTHFLLLIKIVSCLQSVYNYRRPEEYVGCFLKSTEDQVSFSSPGDYRSIELTPLQCMIVCGRTYKYAAIHAGIFCMCSNTLPSDTAHETECSSKCPGTSGYPLAASSAKCGGENRVSIYSVENRILGLTIINPQRIRAFEKVIFEAYLANGKNATFTIGFDDGYGMISLLPNNRSISHIFNQPGLYEVALIAKNNISGSQKASKQLAVIDEVLGVEITCPRGTVFGKPITCHGFVLRGSRIDMKVEFGDAVTEYMNMSVCYSFLGRNIPLMKPAKNKSFNLPSTYIMTSSQFESKEIITSWEIVASATGPILLQIFRPSCTSSEIFCSKSQSCLTFGSDCGNVNEPSCGTNERYCFHSSKCIGIEMINSSTTFCEKQLPSSQTALSDYVVAYQFRFNILTVGHQFHKLQSNEHVVVNAGDVIGWSYDGTPTSGQIAFAEADASHDELEFPLLTQTGSTLKRENAASSALRHLLSAHFHRKAEFILHHAYKKTGTFVLTTNIFRPIEVHVDIPISGVELICPSLVPTGRHFIVRTTIHSGSNIKYMWLPGDEDGTRITTPSQLQYLYKSAAFHTMSISLSNSIGSVNKSCLIHAFDGIKNLTFLPSLTTVALGNSVSVAWTILSGTNVTYSVSFGDGSKFVTVNGGFVPTNYILRHKYSNTGKYNITIKAIDVFESIINISTEAIVEIPIEGIRFFTTRAHVSSFVYVAIGETVTMTTKLNQGSNPVCIYQFSESLYKIETTSLSVTQTYNSSGHFTANVTCKNGVSIASAILNATLITQELQEITGLRLIGHSTAYGDFTRINLEMQTGTLLMCYWNLGDGSIYKSDFHMNAVPLHHQFKSIGDFLVDVQCSNRLGTRNANITISVDYKIRGFSLDCPQQFIRIGQVVKIGVFVSNGTRIKLELIFGNRNESQILSSTSNTTLKFTNTYSEIGVYSIYAIATNSFHSLKRSCPYKIITEYPIEAFEIVTNSPIKVPPGIAEYSWHPSPGFMPPVNVLSYWKFGDGSAKEYWLDLSSRPAILSTHVYRSSGIYMTEIKMRNNVSSKTLLLEIEVNKRLPINFTIRRYDLSSNNLQSGYGDARNVFALEQRIFLNVTKQVKDSWYLFNFGNGESVNKTAPSVTYQYLRPGSFNVSVLLNSPKNTILKWKFIVIQEGIKNANIRVMSNTSRKNVTFSVTATKYGSYPCYVIDFGDMHATVFNDSICDNIAIDKKLLYQFQPFKDQEILVSHIYQMRGTYNVTLHAWNAVSYSKTVIHVNILHETCSKPEIFISGGGTKKQPLKMKRSDKLFLKAGTTLSCEEAKFVLFTWQSFQVNTLGEWKAIKTTIKKTSMPYKDYEGTLEPKTLEIESGDLSIGLNVVTLNISFLGEDQDFSDVVGWDQVWFHTEATPLRAIIQGGIKRAIGYEINLKLDGSKSYDPDSGNVDRNGLQFLWYCRRANEIFGNRYQAFSNTAGCFKDGKYNLTEPWTSKAVVQIFTGHLVQYQSYLIRLVVKKQDRENYIDQEIKVLPGSPPTMDIRCKMNCLDKLNPAERLILESRCTDCLPGANLKFQWSLYEISVLGGANITHIDFQSSTTTGVQKANLVLKENVLKPGKEYSLKISAWKPGGKQGSIGFSQYRFKVNQPPHSGKCIIHPKQGFAIVTKFAISCNNWIDEDMPLTYRIDVVRDGNIANIYNGYENDVQTVLPLGKPTSSFEINITAVVSDRFGYATNNLLTVLVRQPDSVDFDALSNDLSRLSSSGNVQALTQTAIAAGSVMNVKPSTNQSNDNSTNEAVKIRTKILLAVSRLKVCNLQQIKQIGDVYNEMAGKPDEVSQIAQDASTSAMADLSNCMLSSAAQDSSMNMTAFTMLQGSSRLLQANMLRNVKSNNHNSTQQSVSNSSAKIFDTVTNVGGSLLRQMVVGDKPTKMKLPNMDIEMSQVPENADEDSLGFKIPDLASLVGNTTSDGTKQSVGAIVSSMANNPYGSDTTSDDIKSSIVGLSLTDADGNAIDVAGKELTMFVKRDSSSEHMAVEMSHFNESGAMRFHRFNYTSLENAISFEVKPIDHKIKLRLLIGYQKRPSMKSFLKDRIFISREEALKRKVKLPDPFTHVISNGELNRTGSYFVGIMMLNKKELYASFGYNPILNYTLRVFETKCKVWNDMKKQWITNGCKVGPKTTFARTQCTCKINPNADESATTTITKNADQRSGSEKQTTLKTANSIKKVVKRVTFAGGFFVAPNPIDFDKAFKGFSNLASNPVAFSTVLSILGVYLILLFWARREDRKDLLKAGVTPLPDNDPSDQQFYEITIFTGFGASSGTTSRVFIQINGEDGSSEPRELNDSNKTSFQKRSQDTFLASFDDFYGDLTYIRIWHDNSGKNPSWYLSKVAIHDVNTGKKYLFINESWLAVEEGDGSIEKVLSVAGPDEIASFNHLFYSTTQKNLTDNHLWFSVFIRPARSRFTRVQRLSCCLTLIYCAMLTNAMFYQVGGQSNPSSTLKIGPFEFSASQIGIGVMSSLIIFPVNILIVVEKASSAATANFPVFVDITRSVGAKPTKEELSKKKARKFWWISEIFFCCQKKKQQSEFMDIITSVPDSETDLKKKAQSKGIFEDQQKQQLESGDIGLKLEHGDGKNTHVKKKKKKLPWWMKYFAWTLLVLTSFTSAFFVVLYGFTFGKDKSAQWISSMLISFLQDVFISQPIKILFLGLFVALIVKKPNEDEEEDNKKQKDETFLHNDHQLDDEMRQKRPKGIIKFQPPPKEKILAARDIRLKEIKMYGLVKDILIYFVFVMALCTVSYTHLDPKSYQYKKGMEDIFISAAYGGDIEFQQISTLDDYWNWLNTTAVQGLFSTRWYNGQPSISGFTSDMNNNLFGGARLRQLRVKKDSCKVPRQVGNLLTECNDWYSWSDEDTNNYGPNWQRISSNSSLKQSASFKFWQYFSSSELNTYPFAGSTALYSGGGYIAELGKYPAKAYKIIGNLKRQSWLDKRTRAVFLEACVYNAQVNLFAIMNYVVEFLPTNGIVHFHSIKITRLYTYGGSTESFTIACQFFVIFFLLLFTYRESKKIYKQRKLYLKGFWNLVELVMIILVISTISVYFSRLILVNSAIKQIHNNPGQYVSFNKVAKWDELFQYMMSFLVLVSCIKSIRLLSFNKTISLLASTLKGCSKPLATFSVVFLIFFFAYVTFSFIIFVEHLEDFRSFVTCMESTMALLLGSFEFADIQKAQPILGPIYFVTLMLFGVMYILNVFMSIIMDTYAEVKGQLSKQSREYEIVDFMIGRFKRFIGIQPGSGNKDELKDELKNEMETNKMKNENRSKEKSCHQMPQRIKIVHKRKINTEDEIRSRFQKLDKSLNGFYTDDYADDDLVDDLIRKQLDRSSASGMRKEIYNFELCAEAEYKQNLYEELDNWK